MEELKPYWREFVEELPLALYRVTTGYYWNEDAHQIEAWVWDGEYWDHLGSFTSGNLNHGGALGLLFWAEQMKIKPA